MQSSYYPKLPDGSDAIRILTVQPGTFGEPLKCTLECVTFSTKPQYVALSYTWQIAYDDNYDFTTNPSKNTWMGFTDCTINGRDVLLHHNLRLALMYLRSSTSSLTLWVDAVCINQDDMAERSTQVAMMSAIYSRAHAVVAWLGTGTWSANQYPVNDMRTEWLMGQTKELATSIAAKSKPPYSWAPDGETLQRICQSAYWTRVWIIQEACLAKELLIVYGSKVWPYDGLCLCDAMKDTRIRHDKPGGKYDPDANGLAAMFRVLDMREDRYGQGMELVRLVQRNQTAACSEVRDRIYGLIGLARDVSPGRPDGDSAGLKAVAELSRSTAVSWSLTVDYSRRFYDLWVDVVSSVYSRAIAMPPQSDERGDAARIRAWASLVRTAVVVQNAFGQDVENEAAAMRRDPSFPSVIAMGYFVGIVTNMETDYDSIVSSVQAQQDWCAILEEVYQHKTRPGKFRAWNDRFLAESLAYRDEELRRLRRLPNVRCLQHRSPDGAWGPIQNALSNTGAFAAEHAEQRPRAGPGKLRMCLTDGSVLALVPEVVAPNDIIVHFWGCDVAVALRRQPHLDSSNTGIASMYMYKDYQLVGRVATPENWEREMDPDTGPDNKIAICADFHTLQMMTSSAVAF